MAMITRCTIASLIYKNNRSLGGTYRFTYISYYNFDNSLTKAAEINNSINMDQTIIHWHMCSVRYRECLILPVNSRFLQKSKIFILKYRGYYNFLIRNQRNCQKFTQCSDTWHVNFYTVIIIYQDCWKSATNTMLVWDTY